MHMARREVNDNRKTDVFIRKEWEYYRLVMSYNIIILYVLIILLLYILGSKGLV